MSDEYVPYVNPICSLFADGGVIGRNPSSVGGTWAFVLVDAAGNELSQKSGTVLPPEFGFDCHGCYNLPQITNNLTEYYALMCGIAALPDGFAGTIYSDSKITLGRFFQGWREEGIPDSLSAERRMQTDRLGAVQFVLLDGHPTSEQLASGIGKRGNQCSKWNVLCDTLCTQAGKDYIKGIGAPSLAKRPVLQEFRPARAVRFSEEEAEVAA